MLSVKTTANAANGIVRSDPIILAMENDSVADGGYQIEWIGSQGMTGVYITFTSPCTDISAVTFMYDSAQPAGTQSNCTWTVSDETRFTSPVANGADLFSITSSGTITPASVSSVSFPGYGTGCPGSAYTCADWLRINGPGTVASATGDPHLSNIHGKKFDVHDGLHRLVHFPHGASESEALLKIDADASMMSGEQSCYNVFFTSARISGKWVGSDVLLRHDDAPMGKKRFVLGMNGKVHDWSELTKDASNLKFSGTEAVKLSTRFRNASSDTPAGDDVEFSIGNEHPVLVQVWASLGSSELTENNNIQYLNLEVQNLPENTGGLLGLDSYNRPAGSKCGLTNKENAAIDSMDDLVGLAAGKRTKRLQYRISAQTRK